MKILGIFAYTSVLLLLGKRVIGTYIINQTICLIVHVPLPRVQRVKQIPVNARTVVSGARIAASRGPTGETHEVYEFGNHPFKLNVSELYGNTECRKVEETKWSGQSALYQETGKGDKKGKRGKEVEEGKKEEGRTARITTLSLIT
jgi:hypothetical protein